MIRQGTPGVFFDRDGTIIYDVGYPKRPEQVKLILGVEKALAEIKQRGFQLIMVSNQSGVGRGILNLEEAEQVHRQVISCLRKSGIEVDGSYYCFHSPEEHCSCRKPSPEMLFRAAKDLNISLEESFMIGDRESDIDAGKVAGCKTILLTDGLMLNELRPLPDFTASSWQEALTYILKR
jgi:D-glycero-D-manno-heptose 1,7-bisphosphate phosphatase